MENKKDFLVGLLNKKYSSLISGINDLREKEFGGYKLNTEERTALANFDRYRLKVLNNEPNEKEFHLKYRQLQVIANLSDWREFLKEDFF